MPLPWRAPLNGQNAVSSLTVKCAHKEHDLTSDWQRRLQWTGLHADGKDEIVALENDLNKRHDKAGKAFEDDVLAVIDRYGTIPADDLARLIEQHLHGVLDGYEDRYRNGFEELSRAATDHAWERMGRDPVNMRTAALLVTAVEDNRERYRDNFANSFSRIKTLPQNVIDDFQSKMMESMYTDRTKEQVMRSVIGDIIDDLGDDRAAIREVWNKTKKDLQRVLRTETVNAYSRAQLEQWYEEGIREVTRHCVYDHRTCPLCRELCRPGNNIYAVDKLLTVEHPVTEDPDNPGKFLTHPNCYLPGTLVRGDFVKGWRSFYEGPVYEIQTLSGEKLTVTPNHPVLTDRGLVAAKDICPSDNLIRYDPVEGRPGSMPLGDMPVAHTDDQEEPSRIEDVFAAISVGGISSTLAEAAPDYFHGDAAFMVGNVNSVAVDRELLTEPVFADQSKDSILMGIPVVDAGPVRKGTLPLLFDCMDPATGGHMGGGDLPVPLVTVHTTPLKSLRIGLSPKLDASLFEFGSQCKRGNPLSDGNGPDGLSVGVAGYDGVDIAPVNPASLDSATLVRQVWYSGYVYDLQSTSGLMIASNLYASNCRDWFQPVFESRTPSGSASWDDINAEDDALFIDIENQKALVQDVPLGSQEAIERILSEIQTPDIYQFVPDIRSLPEWQASRLEELRKLDPDNAEKLLAKELSSADDSEVVQWTDPDLGKTYISDKAKFSQWVTFPIARRDGENAWFELSPKKRNWWESRYRKRMLDTKKNLNRHGIEIFGGVPFFSQSIEDGETYFSEAYAFYLVDPVTLQMMDPEAYKTMASQMFAGREFIEAGGVN